MRFLVSRDQPAAPRVANAIPSLLFHTYEKSEVAKLLRFSSKLKSLIFYFLAWKNRPCFRKNWPSCHFSTVNIYSTCFLLRFTNFKSAKIQEFLRRQIALFFPKHQIRCPIKKDFPGSSKEKITILNTKCAGFFTKIFGIFTKKKHFFFDFNNPKNVSSTDLFLGSRSNFYGSQYLCPEFDCHLRNDPNVPS